jgi:hypothetical protein
MTDIIRDGSNGNFVSHWGKKSSNGYFDDQVGTACMCLLLNKGSEHSIE